MSMLEKALTFYDQGFWVLPVKQGGKAPGVASWKQYQTTRPTKAEITQWWTSDPTANCGFVTGRAPNLCVLDIDSGKDKLQPHLDKHPTNFVVETSKGYHLYYAYPVDFPIGKRLPNTFPTPGIDFRGDGGFIIAPGSIHESGFVYKATQDTLPLAPLPLNLLQTIIAPPKETDPTSDVWVGQLLSEGSIISERNNDGARLAGYLLGKQLPIDIVKTMMTQWYDQTDRSDGLYTLKEMYSTVESVNKTHARNLAAEIWKDAVIAPSTDVVAAAPKSMVISLQDFFHGPEDVEWLIDGWLPEATTGLMVAPPGGNKTWLSLAMGLAVATGRDFLNCDQYKTHRKGPVLLIQQEDGRSVLRQRLHTIAAQMYEDSGGLTVAEDGTISFCSLAADFDIYDSPKLVRFDDVEIMTEIVKQVNKRRYALVIIDPLYMSAKMDNYMGSAAQDMSILKKMRDEFGTSFLILHHTRKSSDSSKMDRLDIWGSQFLNAWLESGIQLRPIEGSPDNAVRVLRHFKNAGKKEVDILKFDIDTSPDIRKFKIDITPDDRAMIGAQAGTAFNILNLLAEKPCSNQELATATGLAKSTVSKKLNKLLKSGVIARSAETKKYYLEDA